MSNNELLKVLEERQELVRLMNEADEKVKQLTDQLKEHMGNQTLLVVGPYRVTYKEVTRTVADTKALKAAGIYEQYSKQQVTRPFVVA